MPRAGHRGRTGADDRAAGKPGPMAGAHDAGIDYGVLAADIAADNMAAHIAAVLQSAAAVMGGQQPPMYTCLGTNNRRDSGGGGTEYLPPAAFSRRHRRSAAAGSGGRRRRKCSWLRLLAIPVTFFVIYVFATQLSMLGEPSTTSKDGISLPARAARHWAASVNSSLSRQRRQAAPPLSQPSPPPPLVASPPPTLSPVLTDGAQCARPPSAEAAVDVTMVTQASAERLWMIPHICARWGGRMIVVTLRQPGEPPVAWPAMDVGGVGTTANASSRCALLRLSVDAPAAAPEGAATMSKPAVGGGSASGYPINWMRNVGIRCVATSHYFVVDVDFWPSVELLGALREQLHSRAADEVPALATALVVPNFQRSGHGCRTAESASACREAFGRGEIEMPSSFAALRGCLDAGDCVVFDGEYNPQGQASTDVKAWLRLGAGATRRVPCITSERYEPFVALQRTEATPTFDERFSGYGKNKVQLVVHLRRAGYAFEVLGRGFVVHFPHKASASKHQWLHSAAHGRVDRLFVTFGREVQARYAGIAARTPLCSDSTGSAHARLGAAGGGGGTAGGGTGGGTGGGGGGRGGQGAVMGAGGKAPRKSVQQRLDEERRRRELALDASTHGRLGAETRVEHEEE